jgi:histidinol dehydrogenase
MTEVERLLSILPTAQTAGQAWRDYGEVIVCDSTDKMVWETDHIASEHVQDDARSRLLPRQYEELRLVVFGAAHQTPA